MGVAFAVAYADFAPGSGDRARGDSDREPGGPGGARLRRARVVRADRCEADRGHPASTDRPPDRPPKPPHADVPPRRLADTRGEHWRGRPCAPRGALRSLAALDPRSLRAAAAAAPVSRSSR